MSNRSWLVVSGNSEKKLGKAVGTSADAIIVDLVGTDPLDTGDATRQRAAQWLQAHRSDVITGHSARWVRINPLESSTAWRQDLLAVMPTAPEGIVLPRAAGPEAVRQLAAELYELEQVHQIPANTTRIIPLVGETAQSALTIGQYLESGHQRLFGLAWGAGELASSISATRSKDDGGELTDAFRHVRSQVLLTAHACGILAIDTVPADAGDKKSLDAAAKSARADGFSGMIAGQADQIAAINGAFAPSDEEIREARDIVAAFDADPLSGALSYQGRTIDKPHLKLAQRTLGLEQTALQSQSQSAPILRPA